jgi:hypothetical protein
MTVARRLVSLGAVAATMLSAVALLTAPQASASEGSSVKGYGPMDFTNQPDRHGRLVNLTSCDDEFTGPVTADDGNGGIVASLDSVSFPHCNTGTSVTANALPWTLKLQENQEATIEGFDVTITTTQGTCRYTGTLSGAMAFQDVYTLSGTLTRQTGSCGGTDQIGASSLNQVIFRTS